MEFENKEEKIIQALAEKYVNDIITKNKDELYAISEIINKEYKETNICPICNVDGYRYRYNDKTIVAQYGNFLIMDGDLDYLLMDINYCPICGRSIKE